MAMESKQDVNADVSHPDDQQISGSNLKSSPDSNNPTQQNQYKPDQNSSQSEIDQTVKLTNCIQVTSIHHENHVEINEGLKNTREQSENCVQPESNLDIQNVDIGEPQNECSIKETASQSLEFDSNQGNDVNNKNILSLDMSSSMDSCQLNEHETSIINISTDSMETCAVSPSKCPVNSQADHSTDSKEKGCTENCASEKLSISGVQKFIKDSETGFNGQNSSKINVDKQSLDVLNKVTNNNIDNHNQDDNMKNCETKHDDESEKDVSFNDSNSSGPSVNAGDNRDVPTGAMLYREDFVDRGECEDNFIKERSESDKFKSIAESKNVVKIVTPPPGHKTEGNIKPDEHQENNNSLLSEKEITNTQERTNKDQKDEDISCNTELSKSATQEKDDDLDYVVINLDEYEYESDKNSEAPCGFSDNKKEEIVTKSEPPGSIIEEAPLDEQGDHNNRSIDKLQSAKKLQEKDKLNISSLSEKETEKGEKSDNLLSCSPINDSEKDEKHDSLLNYRYKSKSISSPEPSMCDETPLKNVLKSHISDENETLSNIQNSSQKKCMGPDVNTKNDVDIKSHDSNSSDLSKPGTPDKGFFAQAHDFLSEFSKFVSTKTEYTCHEKEHKDDAMEKESVPSKRIRTSESKLRKHGPKVRKRYKSATATESQKRYRSAAAVTTATESRKRYRSAAAVPMIEKKEMEEELFQLTGKRPCVRSVRSRKADVSETESECTEQSLGLIGEDVTSSSDHVKNKQTCTKSKRSYSCDISSSFESQTDSQSDSLDPDKLYNLRPKSRKKSFHFINCKCCRQFPSESDNDYFPVEHFMRNQSYVERLRAKICELFKVLFPELEYPPNFREHTHSVEKLMDQVIAVISDKSEEVCHEDTGFLIEVVLCQSPRQCLKQLCKKTTRLIGTLLPDVVIDEHKDYSFTTISALLDEIILSNNTSSSTS